MSRRCAGIGAKVIGGGRCAFRVWAPRVKAMEVIIGGEGGRSFVMQPRAKGYFEAIVEGAQPGARYMYRLDGARDLPDPASRFQPQGVHGPSEIVDISYEWTDEAWRGVALEQAVFYELHVGTFTEAGTFEAVIEHVDRLHDLGITLIELMPVAQFPGGRNWGYDGASPFAVQNTYGGPRGLKRLVNECHARGMGVAMDVVYNHLGPEGNYLDAFGPYFTEKYRTPWGKAVNFDDAWCDEVRGYFIENALMWVEEYHLDALRLDAVHAIFDQSAHAFLHELADAVHARARELGRHVLVIAESDLNDPKLVRSSAVGGWGMDGAWSDDVHHALHALLTGEREGYYADFGGLRHLARAMRDGFVYAGQRSSHHNRRHGAMAVDVPPMRHVVCSQNHDQVGNRMKGERLSALVSLEQLKIAAVLVLCSPFTPLLFMGEEYGETAPFQYFVSHGDEQLVEAVRKGRASEFASFGWKGEVPDPQAEDTFIRSKLNRARRESAEGRALEQLYRELFSLRSSVPAVRSQSRIDQDVQCDEPTVLLVIRRGSELDEGEEVLLAVNFGKEPVTLTMPDGPGMWHKRLDTAEAQWHGPGSRIGAEVALGTDVELVSTSAVLFSRAAHKGEFA